MQRGGEGLPYLVGNYMDSKKRKSNWRRIQQRSGAETDVVQRKLILFDAIRAIEIEHGPYVAELIYPFEKLIELHHDLNEREFASLLLSQYYLVLEMNFIEEPERLLAAVEKMWDQGYVSEALSACCRLLYLLYESYAVKKQLTEDAWYLLDEMHKQLPDVTAQKLLKYLRKKHD